MNQEYVRLFKTRIKESGSLKLVVKFFSSYAHRVLQFDQLLGETYTQLNVVLHTAKCFVSAHETGFIPV